MRKLKDIKNIFSKLVYITIGIVLCVLLYIPKNQVSAEEQPIIGNSNGIKILATEPQEANLERSYRLKAINTPDFKINVNLSTLTTVDKDDKNIDTPQRDGDSINVKKTSRVKAGYTIEPQALQYGDAVNTMQKEIAVLIDTSMNDSGNKFTQSKNAIRDCLVNKYLSQDINNDRDDVKFDFITYGDNVSEQYVNSKDKDQNGVLIDYRNQLQQKLDSIRPDNSTKRSLGQGIGKALKFFEANNQEGSGKTIIIISSGDPTDTIGDDTLQKIKDNNYNIITLAVGNKANEENPYEVLFSWHNKMGGLLDDYYISKPDSGGVYNDIMNEIFPKVSARLGSFKYKTYLLKDLKLNFNLGSDIDLDKGLIDNPDSNNPKEYIQNIPNVKYIAKEEGNPKKLIYYGYFESETITNSTTSYETDFIIKPNQTSNVNRRIFQGDNLLTYVDEVNEIRKSQLLTPILILNSVKADHGVFKCVSGKRA